MTQKTIHTIYKQITEYHKKYLKKHGVNLPKLKNNKGTWTKDALILVYLSQYYPQTKIAYQILYQKYHGQPPNLQDRP